MKLKTKCFNWIPVNAGEVKQRTIKSPKTDLTSFIL